MENIEDPSAVLIIQNMVYIEELIEELIRLMTHSWKQ